MSGMLTDIWAHSTDLAKRVEEIEKRLGIDVKKEDATPADLPKPGDVWGVPGKPETRRLVKRVDGAGVTFACMVESAPHGCYGTVWKTSHQWQSWVRESGAVRIDDAGERDAAVKLRMKAAEDGLRQANQRIEDMRDSVAAVAKERDELQARVKELEGECDELRHKFDALKRFKDWTHARLDSLGVPDHPPGVHGAEGCRIGDRMDWLEKERDELQARVKELEGEVARLRDVCQHPSTYYSVEHDNYYCSKCKAGMGEAYYRERHATQTETEQERDELRAANERLMAALRGILNVRRIRNNESIEEHRWYQLQEIETTAREAIAKEEGGGKAD